MGKYEYIITDGGFREFRSGTSFAGGQTTFAEDLPVLDVDLEQIEQVLINLASNTFEAVPQGGTVSFRTCQKNENTVSIEAADTGGGIPPDALERIFDPFFTTKDKGTGLGLSIAQKIVTQHGGK